MKLIPSDLSPTRRKVQRNAAGSGAEADARGTVVRLSTIGVVQVIRVPAELRFAAESVRLIRDGDRLIVEPVGKRAAPVSPLPFGAPAPESPARPRRRAPDADGRVPAPLGPKLGR